MDGVSHAVYDYDRDDSRLYGTVPISVLNVQLGGP